MSKKLRIILTGGGTGGPTTPLLAVAEQIRKLQPATELLFLGTKNGPERKLVESAGIDFRAIPAGKFRRYFSLRNVSDLFLIIKGYFVARKIIREFRPDLVFTVGSFVGVPVAFAARKQKVKILIHQQDAQISLANKLVAPFADYITTAFEQTAREFYNGSGLEVDQPVRTEWVGNPVRKEFLQDNRSWNNNRSHPRGPDALVLGLHLELPVLLITGGASGAQQINQVVAQALPELVKAHQIIHITGRGKQINFTNQNYHQFEFLGREMSTAMKLADIVVARAGLSTIAELSALGKVSVIVPMPDSHQEENAEVLKKHNAAVILDKQEFTSEILTRVVISLKFNQKRCELLSNNMQKIMPHDSANRLANIIIKRYE